MKHPDVELAGRLFGAFLRAFVLRFGLVGLGFMVGGLIGCGLSDLAWVENPGWSILVVCVGFLITLFSAMSAILATYDRFGDWVRHQELTAKEKLELFLEDEGKLG